MKTILPINVIFILPTLQAGGAERVVSFVAENLDKKKFKVKLIVTGSKEDGDYDLDNINLIYLNKSKVRYAVLSIIKELLQNRSKIVFSSLSHLNLVVAFISTIFPKRKFIARETYIRANTPGYHLKKKKKDIFIESISFKMFDNIICQSTDMMIDTKNEFNVKEGKLKIIGNPITDNFYFEKNKKTLDTIHPKFITVGRLHKIKGHQRILKILSQLKYNFTYTIVGDGPLKEEIFDYAKKLNLDNKIQHIPFTKDVQQFLKKSDFYLQGSFTEGFPNALLESCAVGTPAIAFYARGGTQDIIENNINGFIVANEEEFLLRLNDLPELDPELVSESVYKKFDKTIILKEYEQFFMQIVKNK